MNTIARVTSIIFHPLLMATYLMALLSYELPSALHPVNIDSFRSFLLLIFIMTFALPSLIISFFRIFGSIDSFAMISRRERVIPFFFITASYVFITWMFITKSRIGFEDSLFKLLLIIDSLVFIGAIITLFYKVSVHSIGIMGMLGILLPLNKVAENNTLFIPTIVVLIIAGLVMSARLQLNAHTPREVLVGASTGFIVGFFGMNFLF